MDESRTGWMTLFICIGRKAAFAWCFWQTAARKEVDDEHENNGRLTRNCGDRQLPRGHRECCAGILTWPRVWSLTRHMRKSDSNHHTRHVLVIGSTCLWLANVRGDLIKGLLALGYRVTAIAEDYHPEAVKRIHVGVYIRSCRLDVPASIRSAILALYELCSG